MMLVNNNKQCCPLWTTEQVSSTSSHAQQLSRLTTNLSALSSTPSLPAADSTGSMSAAAIAAAASLQTAVQLHFPGVTPSTRTSQDHRSRSPEENRTNLIVNYLPQNMSQEEVRALFAQVGHIESCKLIRDKTTGQSLGYAFVNYKEVVSATEAVKSMNGLRLQNKTIKVSVARPSCEAIKGANLYISGIPKSWSQLDLETLFSQAGQIITSRILCDHTTGMSKGVGFIRYNQKLEAETAIQKFNGYMPTAADEAISVKFANSPASGKSAIGLSVWSSYTSPARRLVGGPLHSLGTRYSSVLRYSPLDASVPMLMAASPLVGASLQVHAPVTASLHTALPSYPLSTVLSSPLPAQPAANKSSEWWVFVNNLAPETDEGGLWQLFGPLGAVQRVNVIKDAQTQKCKGYAFVKMTNYEDALLAVSSLNGLAIGSKILQVSLRAQEKKPLL